MVFLSFRRSAQAENPSLPPALNMADIDEMIPAEAASPIHLTMGFSCEISGQSLFVLKPQHQSLHRREVSRSESHSHDEAVADIYPHQCQRASRMLSAVNDEYSCEQHPCREADGGYQRGFAYILFNHISHKSRRHSKEEYSKAECPLNACFPEAYMIRDLLGKHRPAVYRTDTAVQ